MEKYDKIKLTPLQRVSPGLTVKGEVVVTFDYQDDGAKRSISFLLPDQMLIELIEALRSVQQRSMESRRPQRSN